MFSVYNKSLLDQHVIDIKNFKLIILKNKIVISIENLALKFEIDLSVLNNSLNFNSH